jgi:hemolysin activation/secretion protein
LQPAPPATPPPTVALPESVPQRAPPGAQNLHVTVARLVVDGGFPELSPQTASIAAAVEGTHVSVADLYTASAALEHAYAKAGYFLVRVVVPQQRLIDGGDFHVTVVDGFFEAVDDDAVPARIRQPVRAIMASLAGRRHLRLDEVQARLTAA